MDSNSPSTSTNNSPQQKDTRTHKRKRSQESATSYEDDDQFSTTKQLKSTEKAQGIPVVALPPPLLQYSNEQFIIVHPQQAAYYHMYHPQQPIYYTNHPYNSKESSTTTSPSSLPSQSTKAHHILPKTPEPNASPTSSEHQIPASSYYHPYVIPSSTLIPPPYAQHNTIPNNSFDPAKMGSTADEREKARKVSHSAIEKRRREKINDKISQLRQLIPTCMDQQNLHKMTILQSAIDYISYLKEIVSKLNQEQELEDILKGDHLRVKVTRSLIPKEVEPFTNQFSVRTNNKSLKPMDVIKYGLSSTENVPLTPPFESQQNETSTTTEENKHMSIQNILC